MPSKKHRTPNTYFILSLIIVIVAISTWIIPSGEYDVVQAEGKDSIKPGTYHLVEQNPQGLGDVFIAPVRGFVDAALIIGLVLIVGGAFAVFKKTMAIDALILAVAKAHKKSKMVRLFLLPILMIMFSLAGAVFGMSEEVIPFILIFIPLALMLGYDSITGIAIPFIGAGAGFAGAFLNPFTIGIAQGIAEIPLFSGIEYRLFVWGCVTALAIGFVSLYAYRIKRNPERSTVFEHDQRRKINLNIDKIMDFEGLTRQHKGALLVFSFGMLVLIFGVLSLKWYIEEIAALFLVLGIIIGMVARLNISEITDSFISGAKDLVGAALVIALARGILIIAEQGLIIDTILYSLSSLIKDLNPILSAQSMMVLQTAINFFMPSGSGQAALTMPIMAPLADLVGISRQTAVLAFQFGDGFSNMIIPTSAVTMGVLTLADIPWQTWARWILPLEILFLILGFALLIPPFIINWQ